MLNLATKKHERKASTCSFISEPTVTIADVAPQNNLVTFRRGALCGAAADDRYASTSSSEDTTFRLNIGGKSYRFRQDVILECRQESLLSVLIRANHDKRLMFTDGFRAETGEYYLERNVRVAEHIADYYITGKLHRPHDICAERFKEELQFWRLSSVEFAPCCSYFSDLPRMADSSELDKEFEGACCETIRKSLWRVMEEPSSSSCSIAFSVISIFFIFTSVIGLVMGSMPEFQEDNRYAPAYHVNHYRRRPNGHKYDQDVELSLAEHNYTDFVYRPTDNPNYALVVMEYVCIAWFTFEYLLRFIVSPHRGKFLKSPMNVIDLFTILPFYVELLLSLVGVNAEKLKEITGAMLVIRVLRVLRMTRVFKLARYSTGLQIFGNTLHASIAELSMLGIFLITGTVFFSTIMYFLEKDEPNSDFTSIPAACWWCIVTITTVGFGDVYVTTTMGKIVAAITSIIGIIILAFPVSMIVENFAHAQHQALIQNQLRQSQMASIANNYLLRRYPSRRKTYKGQTNSLATQSLLSQNPRISSIA